MTPATSDLIVVGEVTAIERGRFHPDPDPASRIGYRNVTLAVSETLKEVLPERWPMYRWSAPRSALKFPHAHGRFVA